MKKSIWKVTLVIVFALMVGLNVYNVQKTDMEMSELALANEEALAGNEGGSGGFNCWWDSVDYMICYSGGDWTGCPCGSHEW